MKFTGVRDYSDTVSNEIENLTMLVLFLGHVCNISSLLFPSSCSSSYWPHLWDPKLSLDLIKSALTSEPGCLAAVIQQDYFTPLHVATWRGRGRHNF